MLKKSILPTFGILLLILSLAAQEIEACLAIVDQAINNTMTLCADIGSNQACIANPGVTVEFVDGADETFTEVGDVVDLASLSSLQLSPMDESAEEWGFVVIHASADMPDDSDQYATILAYGDVNISELSPTMDTFNFSNATDDSPCEGAPASGLLIDTPDDAGTVTFRMNDRFELAFNSTGTVSYDEDDLIFDVFLALGQIQARAKETDDVWEEIIDHLYIAELTGRYIIEHNEDGGYRVDADENADAPEGLDRLAGALDEETRNDIADSLLSMLEDEDLSALSDTYYFNLIATGAEGLDDGDTMTVDDCALFGEGIETGQLDRSENGITMTLTAGGESLVIDLTSTGDASYEYIEAYPDSSLRIHYIVLVGAPPRFTIDADYSEFTDFTCYYDLVEVTDTD